MQTLQKNLFPECLDEDYSQHTHDTYLYTEHTFLHIVNTYLYTANVGMIIHRYVTHVFIVCCVLCLRVICRMYNALCEYVYIITWRIASSKSRYVQRKSGPGECDASVWIMGESARMMSVCWDLAVSLWWRWTPIFFYPVHLWPCVGF